MANSTTEGNPLLPRLPLPTSAAASLGPARPYWCMRTHRTQAATPATSAPHSGPHANT
jgi:hypothetical protein